MKATDISYPVQVWLDDEIFIFDDQFDLETGLEFYSNFDDYSEVSGSDGTTYWLIVEKLEVVFVEAGSYTSGEFPLQLSVETRAFSNFLVERTQSGVELRNINLGDGDLSNFNDSIDVKNAKNFLDLSSGIPHWDDFNSYWLSVYSR